MQESLELRLTIAESIADDRKAAPADRMRALDFLGRYGLGTANSLAISAIDKGWVSEQLTAIRRIVLEMLPGEQGLNLLHRISQETFRDPR